MTTIPGLQHVTAICGPAQANVDFVTGVLGQRRIKNTVNFDAPDTHHLKGTSIFDCFRGHGKAGSA